MNIQDRIEKRKENAQRIATELSKIESQIHSLNANHDFQLQNLNKAKINLIEELLGNDGALKELQDMTKEGKIDG